MNSKPIAFVFCRGGSKGLPGKNIRPVAGKPLLQHTVDLALGCGLVDKVIVSTDDAAIAHAASRAGAVVLDRPSALAADNTPEILAWRHAIANTPDLGPVFLSLPATAPLRAAADISAALQRLAMGDCDMVIGVTPSHRNPWFNMVERDETGRVSVVNHDPSVTRRQDAPDVFDITTCVYAARPNYVMETENLFAGRIASVLIPPERSLDIDTAFDLHLAEQLLTSPFASGNEGAD